MELVFVFVFLFLWIFTTLFFSLWVKNLINKLKLVAEKRQEQTQILYEFVDKLEEISNHQMWIGEPMFREHKLYTEKLIRYLQNDFIEEEIKFIYEK